MKTLKKIWEFLSGKKTVIGMVLMLAAQGLQAFFPNVLTPEQIAFLNTAGAAIGGIGLIHKGTKTDMMKKFVHKK